MAEFTFKSPATETLQGTAYFTVEAETEQEARAKLADDSGEYFTDFNESDGSTEWAAKTPEQFEGMG